MSWAEDIREASLAEPHARTVERLVRESEEHHKLYEENKKLRARGDKYYSEIEGLLATNKDLRETIRWYGRFVNTVKEACVQAQIGMDGGLRP